jgi:ring-1,2-phenylacetyl-CoA epoxidase subunit PaaC
MMRSGQREPAGAAPAGGLRPAGVEAVPVLPEKAFFEYLLRLGDDRLVLGHRLSEWCGHGPMLEEDIALANVALDLVGQATHVLHLAGQVEGKGRDEDALAYFRDAIDYRNVNLVELPNGDYGRTIVRQFLFDAWSVLLLERLQQAAHPELAGIAAKAYKEARYHVRHSGEWVLRLGDGTEESHRRAQTAFDELWPYTGELFETDEVDRLLADAIAPDPAALEPAWREIVGDVVRRATLSLPAQGYMHTGGRQGRHTEHLGHLLSEMQILARSHPGAKW